MNPNVNNLSLEAAWDADGDIRGGFVYQHDGLRDPVGPRTLADKTAQDYRDFLAGGQPILTFCRVNGEIQIERCKGVAAGLQEDHVRFVVEVNSGEGFARSVLTLPMAQCWQAFQDLICLREANS